MIKSLIRSNLMCSNELFRRDTIQRRVCISLARVYIGTKPYFEVQMCQIGTFCRSHSADLVAALHFLPGLNSNRV